MLFELGWVLCCLPLCSSKEEVSLLLTAPGLVSGVPLRHGVVLRFWQAAHLQKLVLTPLSALLSLFPGPQKLIQKRYDKLLDYNSYLQGAAADESDLAKREYEALNAQLVEELQVFNLAARKILLNCLCSFVTLLRDLMIVAQRVHTTTVPVSTAAGSVRNHTVQSSLLIACLSVVCMSVVSVRECSAPYPSSPQEAKSKFPGAGLL